MSGSSSATTSTNSGLVDSLRRSATTERLRTDHIMTLEIMQETMDENVSLKEMNKRLLAQLLQLGGTAPSDETAGASGGDEDKIAAEKANAQMVQRLLKQEKELADLRVENKTLKSRATADEKRLRELQVAQGKYEAMRIELQKLKGMSDAASPASSADGAEQGEVTALRQQLQDVTSELTAAQEYLAAHIPACQAKIDVLSQELLDAAAKQEAATTEAAAAGAAQAEALASLDAVSAEFEALQGKHSSLEAKHKDLRRSANDTERSILDRMHAAEAENVEAQAALSAVQQTHADALLAQQAEVKRLQRLVSTLQAELAEALKNRHNPLLLPAAEEAEGGGDSAFFLTGAITIAPIEEAQGVARDKGRDRDRDRDDRGGGEGNSDGKDLNFAEFVRLRKENKSLKLQLLEVSQAHTHGNHGKSRAPASGKGGTSFFG